MDTYNPDQAAPLIGASASTVRNWCKTYGDQLSEGAKPPTGTERRLTTDDIAKLQRVKVWRDHRLPPQEIARLLQAAASTGQPSTITIDATPQPRQDAQEAAGDALLLPVVLSSIERRQDATDARLQSLERALATVEQRQTERHNALITGLVVGGAFVLVLVALVLALPG